MTADFLTELQALLKKHGAELTADDHWTGYAECGSDVRITVEFGDWQKSEIDLGRWIDGEKHGGVK